MSKNIFARYEFVESDTDNVVGILCGKQMTNLKKLTSVAKAAGHGGLYFKIYRNKGIVISGYTQTSCDYGLNLLKKELTKIKETIAERNRVKVVEFNIGDITRDTFHSVFCPMVKGVRVGYNYGKLTGSSRNPDLLEEFSIGVYKYIEEKHRLEKMKEDEKKIIEDIRKEEIKKAEQDRVKFLAKKQANKLKNYKKRERKKKNKGK